MLALEQEIHRRIRAAGPMPVGQFMAICLTHPKYGYYSGSDPLGEAGDFTTSPEISQMFGELIGLWAATIWRAMGEPAAINLVELGPGRGTMMADIMRAVKLLPAFEQAISIHLVETSPTLRERQRQKLAEYGDRLFWYSALRDVPTAPAIYLANEFFDALPVNQAIRQPDGWHERTIEIDDQGQLRFGLAETPLPMFEYTIPRRVHDAPVGSIFEWRSLLSAMELGRRLNSGGAALVIDYGHQESALGDTFQAVRGHRFDNPLAAPGLADLSAHVDFEALASAAASFGTNVHGPVDQGSFLVALGIERRVANLKRNATPEKAAAVDIALERLTAANKTGMGAMFKVLGLSHTSLPQLPGFERKTPVGHAA
ncbi:MAG: class I SAM-dependent methyltransferase [Xanthobacteraceae bacterium]